MISIQSIHAIYQLARKKYLFAHTDQGPAMIGLKAAGYLVGAVLLAGFITGSGQAAYRGYTGHEATGTRGRNGQD